MQTCAKYGAGNEHNWLTLGSLLKLMNVYNSQSTPKQIYPELGLHCSDAGIAVNVLHPCVCPHHNYSEKL